MIRLMVEGEAHAIEAIAAWARRGQPAARVSNVVIDDGPALEPVAGDFKILPTL